MRKRILLAAAAVAVVASVSTLTVINANADEAGGRSAPVVRNVAAGTRPANLQGTPTRVVLTESKGTAAGAADPGYNCEGFVWEPSRDETYILYGYAEVRCDRVVASITMDVSVIGAVGQLITRIKDTWSNDYLMGRTAVAICPAQQMMSSSLVVDIVTPDYRTMHMSAVTPARLTC